MTSLIVPRPIAWVGSRSPEGVDNLAPFSYFMGVSSRPPALAISVARRGRGPDGTLQLKDTARNILANGQLTVSLVSRALAQPMVQTSADWPRDVSEFGAAGMTARRGERVEACFPAEAAVSLECQLIHSHDLGTTTLFVAEVLLFHVADDVLLPGSQDSAPVADPRRLDPLARLGGQDYTGLGELLRIARPTLPEN